MDAWVVALVIGAYFVVLILISYLTSKNVSSKTFYTADRSSPWYLVAFGMIGASLSGVTFISVPGQVASNGFSYFALILGHLPGYLVVAFVLLPIFYKINAITIYGYLEKRFGFYSFQTGSIFFLLSRVVGASFRLFLVAGVLQLALFNALGVPFWVTVLVTIGLIWTYTVRGGIKTIVFTDTLQTTFMVGSVIICLFAIASKMELSLPALIGQVQENEMSKIFFFDDTKRNFWKQFLAGIFIVIAMTGLDQDMMQKNLTCRSIKDAQKNMVLFSIILVVVNLIFLSLGASLYLYAEKFGIPIPERSDDLFPFLALNEFSLVIGVFFLLGITAAAYSSADSALTSLTTTFCVDILDSTKLSEAEEKSIRTKVHIGFSILLFVVVMLFSKISNKSVVEGVFTAAGYTYGPILGLFTFGLLTKFQVRDKWVPMVCFLAPILSYVVASNSKAWFDYTFGFELLIFNGLITFLGLLLLSINQGSRTLEFE